LIFGKIQPRAPVFREKQQKPSLINIIASKAMYCKAFLLAWHRERAKCPHWWQARKSQDTSLLSGVKKGRQKASHPQV
jgi:hypothetical protein